MRAGLFIFSCTILINMGEVIRRLLRDLEDANQRETMLNAELRHRAKNTLAVVQSMAVMTYRSSGPSAFLDDFSARILALARVTDIANAQTASERRIAMLIDMAVAPFKDEARIDLSGPDCTLLQASCIPLALILHELCTNSVKYGALSTELGSVSITWKISANDSKLAVFWKETGGPCVVEPSRRGMGSALMRAQNGIQEVEHRFASDGVECTIVIGGVDCTHEQPDGHAAHPAAGVPDNRARLSGPARHA